MSDRKEAFIGKPYHIYELPSLQRGEVVKFVYTRDDERNVNTIFVILDGCRLTRDEFGFVFRITAMAVIFSDDTICYDDGLLLTNEVEIRLNDYCVVRPSHQDVDRLNRLFVAKSYPLSIEYEFV